ncbi:cell wall hydrolase [bacterium]|nr:cell wall hydrolase [bacterium]
MRRLIRQTCIILSVIGLIFLILSNGKDSTKEETKVVEAKQNTSVWIVERNKETHTETWTRLDKPVLFDRHIKPPAVPVAKVKYTKTFVEKDVKQDVSIEKPVEKPVEKPEDKIRHESITKTIEFYLTRLDELGGSARIASDELYCMAENIYYEARSEPLEGQVAVALVTMNRVNSPDYPSTVCGVIKQGPMVESWKTRGKDVPDEDRKYYPRRHRCQFSWWCDGKAEGRKVPKYWDTALAISLAVVMDKAITDLTNGATHYHATYVNPKWAKKALVKHQIGEHIFYRLKD